MSETARKSLYSIHPGFAMEAASLANLERRTGKTLDDEVRHWLRVAYDLDA